MIVIAIKTPDKKVVAFYAEVSNADKLRLVFQISIGKGNDKNIILGYKKELYASFGLEGIKKVYSITDIIRYISGRLRLNCRTIYFRGKNSECLELFEKILDTYCNKERKSIINHEDILNTRYLILASN